MLKSPLESKLKYELLLPAGDLNRLKVACLYGADAVYIGGYNYSLRANANNFSLEEIKKFNTSSLITRTTNDITQVEMVIGLGLQLLIACIIASLVAS